MQPAQDYDPNNNREMALDPVLLKSFMEERRRLVWLIGLGFRPGVALFNSYVEYTMYPPETEANDSYELLEIAWEGCKWAVCGVPIRDLVTIRAIANACGLRIADSVPTMLTMEQGQPVAQARFPMDTKRCFTLENKADMKLSSLPPDRLHNVLVAESKLCSKVWNGWRPSRETLAEAMRTVVNRELSKGGVAS